MKKAVILVSGGVDSSTVLAIAKSENYEIHAISFNYCQRNLIELDLIKSFIKDYDVAQHKIINIDLKNIGGSALTDGNISVPKYESHLDVKNEIPVSYVPARNTIFLSYALGFAEIVKATNIFIGVHASDYANYPDCRPEYIEAFETLANLATANVATNVKIKIRTPLINMTKAQIIATGLKLGVDYSKTISCYDPSEDGASCGSCLSCLLRRDAFAANELADPIKYKV